MKKLLKLLITAVCCCVIFTVAVSAQGGINANEQTILQKIQTPVKVGEKEYVLPSEYFNQARNFFLTVEVTKDESDQIVGYIDEGLILLESQKDKFSSQTNFENFDPAVKSQILDLGQRCVQVLDLKLVYENGNVIITDANGKTVFTGAAVIKVTGANNVSLGMGVVAASLIAVAYVLSVGAFLKREKNYE